MTAGTTTTREWPLKPRVAGHGGPRGPQEATRQGGGERNA
ncbi:MAG: hypothetical protein JWQ77_134 [Jatrophihabitans sp.]|nr:hypothetical protein [Jatrophihabitans sp.]